MEVRTAPAGSVCRKSADVLRSAGLGDFLAAEPSAGVATLDAFENVTDAAGQNLPARIVDYYIIGPPTLGFKGQLRIFSAGQFRPVPAP